MRCAEKLFNHIKLSIYLDPSLKGFAKSCVIEEDGSLKQIVNGCSYDVAYTSTIHWDPGPFDSQLKEANEFDGYESQVEIKNRAGIQRELEASNHTIPQPLA